MNQRMTRILAAGSVATLLLLAGLGGALPARAAQASAPQQCLNLTNAVALNTSAITKGLGLTVDQVREMRARLSQYNSLRGFQGFDGLELTPEQITMMKARIAAQLARHNHPLGWPCKVFKNRARTVKFVRALLVGNGFRPYSITFYGSSPNQIQFSGIQDGVRYAGAVARSGVREITIQLSAPDVSGETQTFTTPFDA